MSVCVLVMCFGARLFVRVSCMFVCPVSVCVLVLCFGVRVFVCVSMYMYSICLFVRMIVCVLLLCFGARLFVRVSCMFVWLNL